ncbi:hypothetical protein GCM10011511_15250 [Puia dinghuensis]|uniref:Uncharacterized protein n=1 Tax=Puia dinghuensis TaxID=1792502 RepID=A0A8J2UB98_9BACT|nr:hypothetical protein GCM10011511_15250 [Puia dinghuensis]
MNERFPDYEGFQLTVERFHHFPQTIDRETFCKTIESGNPVDILKLFVTEEGFQQFQKEKKQLDLKEEEAIDDAHSYFPIAHSIWGYYEGYYLVELNQDQQHQYLLPGYQPIHSDNYLLLEYELYLSYLQLGDC